MEEIRITPPDGYEIDTKNSTFDCIKFKPVVKRWRDDASQLVHGYYITSGSGILDAFQPSTNTSDHYNVFSTVKQAKSALAMARISQIMAHDKRFGGVVTDEEWEDNTINKYVIVRSFGGVLQCEYCTTYQLLAFHTEAQRELFLKENEDLVRDYLML